MSGIYVFRETNAIQRQVLICGLPVQYNNVQRIRLDAGNTISLSTFSHNGSAIDISINGNNNNFYSPLNPYSDGEALKK